MLFYRFNPDNGEFVRAEMAFIDPLESQQRGVEVFLVPSNAVATPPPELTENTAAVWNGENWQVVADFRGQSIWNAAGAARLVKELGEIPAGWSLTAPETPEVPDRVKRFSKLKIIRALGGQWAEYRRQLEYAGLLDEFFAAEYLSEDDPAFVAFMSQVPPEVAEKLQECEI
jgi:hypothetical protein